MGGARAPGVDILAASITAGIFMIFLAYFLLYSRHHLVASAPEEEFSRARARVRGCAA
jgi:ethanolamine permease